MLDTPEVIQTDAKRTAVIRLTIPRSEIQAVMGPAMGEVIAAVQAQGISPVGPLFSRHFKMDPQTFDFEVGLPINADIKPTGRVKPGQLPATTVARTVFQGGYEGMGPAWGEFDAWLKSQGHTASGELWEYYLTGPESGPDSSRYRTEFNRPLVSVGKRP